ncbi:unnamed protein product, partial [Ectocarpus fasciculatus]
TSWQWPRARSQRSISDTERGSDGPAHTATGLHVLDNAGRHTGVVHSTSRGPRPENAAIGPIGRPSQENEAQPARAGRPRVPGGHLVEHSCGGDGGREGCRAAAGEAARVPSVGGRARRLAAAERPGLSARQDQHAPPTATSHGGVPIGHVPLVLSHVVTPAINGSGSSPQGRRGGPRGFQRWWRACSLPRGGGGGGGGGADGCSGVSHGSP